MQVSWSPCSSEYKRQEPGEYERAIWWIKHTATRAIDANFLRDDPEVVVERWEAGDIEAITLHCTCEESGITEIKAWCLFDICDTAEGPMLRVVALQGEDMALWIDELVEFLKAAAETNDLKGVTFLGRKGWERELAKYEFQPMQTIMRMKV